MVTTREIKGMINTEDPSIHWSFLPVDGETILDLGCGINNNEHLPTPMYWVQKGARQVYGVDPSQESYNWFNTNFKVKNFLPIMDYVDRLEKFELYFNATKPSVVKIDVEGSEIFLMGMKPELLQGVRHIGIEYHNLSCLLACEHLLRDNGYELSYYKFNHLDIDYQGVLHAHKKNVIVKQRPIPQTPDEQHTQDMEDWSNNLDDYHKLNNL
jgi:SAM-dependent methyltransferase